MLDTEQLRSILATILIPITINTVVLIGLMILDQSLFNKFIQRTKILFTIAGYWTFMSVLMLFLTFIITYLLVPAGV